MEIALFVPIEDLCCHEKRMGDLADRKLVGGSQGTFHGLQHLTDITLKLN